MDADVLSKDTIIVGSTLAFVTRSLAEIHKIPVVTVHLAPSIIRTVHRPPRHSNRSVADRPDDRCGTEPATDSIGTAVIGSTKRTSSSECSLSGLLSRSRIGRRTCVSRVFRFTTMRNRSHCHPTSKPSWQAESRRSHSRREPRMQEHTNSSPRPPKRAVNPASVAFCSRDRFPLSYLRA